MPEESPFQEEESFEETVISALTAQGAQTPSITWFQNLVVAKTPGRTWWHAASAATTKKAIAPRKR